MNRKAQYIVQKQGRNIAQAMNNDRSSTQFHDPKDVCLHIASYVPNKALQWVVNQFIAGNVLLEDLEGLKTDLDIFYSKSRMHKLDINTLSKTEFYKAVEQYAGAKTKTTIKMEGAKRVMDGDLLIIELLSPEAAVYYAAGTKWCTSNSQTAQGYMKTDKLYIIIHRESGKKFQLHYESNQLCNELDVTPTAEEVALLSQCDEWGDFIDFIYQSKYNLSYD